MCVSVCIYVCMYVCMFVYVYVYVYMVFEAPSKRAITNVRNLIILYNYKIIGKSTITDFLLFLLSAAGRLTRRPSSFFSIFWP